MALLCSRTAWSEQVDIISPPGSDHFGASVAVLPNGNIAIAAPGTATSGVGAAYLFSPDGLLISTLTGSHPNDRVGSEGFVVLENGNYLIVSRNWNGTDGAVTWASAEAGVSGVISADNSLLGTPGPYIAEKVVALHNGNYVVVSTNWAGVGAVTWGNGDGGTVGPISSTNSLIGTTLSDEVGIGGITELSNGNYVVASGVWHNGDRERAGAVTWGNGNTGISGHVSAANSLVGESSFDGVGGVTALSNGNYVVVSSWTGGTGYTKGAVTWVDGSASTSGVVSASNSLVGTASDAIASGGVIEVSNGNYVVSSPNWDNGTVEDAGAVTWVDAHVGTHGLVSVSNSLVGTRKNDQVGVVTALSNGNYVVASAGWNNSVGAVTWGEGNTGISGSVSAANSQIGAPSYPLSLSVAPSVTALGNGNYVVASPYVETSAGATLWLNGNAGVAGVVSPADSLTGHTAYDGVGDSVVALSNGNYVVVSSNWHNDAGVAVGTVTWGSCCVRTHGAVSLGNSLYGTAADSLTASTVIALANGNYVVAAPQWSNYTGAVTWGNGDSGTIGAISTENSLVGSVAHDRVGTRVTALSSGDYVVTSSEWDNGVIVDAGAITLLSGTGPSNGTISADNSVLGTAANGGASMVFSYDATRDRLVVGRPAENTVTIMTRPQSGRGHSTHAIPVLPPQSTSQTRLHRPAAAAK